jgi:large subunit ribosomal protein L29
MKENADKIRALDATEMAKQLREGAEQSFRLRFQLTMGQPDGLKKIRQLRKERARILTIQRERELGKSETPADSAKTVTAKKAAAKKSVAAPKSPAKAVGKKAAPKATAKTASKKPAASKKVAKG